MSHNFATNSRQKEELANQLAHKLSGSGIRLSNRFADLAEAEEDEEELDDGEEQEEEEENPRMG